MIKRSAWWVPLGLGLTVSACSTTQQSQTDIQSPVTNEAPVSAPVEVETEVGSSTDAELTSENQSLQAQIVENEEEIALLKARLDQNNKQLTQLNAALDQKDQRIQALESQPPEVVVREVPVSQEPENTVSESPAQISEKVSTEESESQDAQLLLQLEQAKEEREELERRYAQLLVDNDVLQSRIVGLEAENASLRARLQQADEQIAGLKQDLATGSGNTRTEEEYQTLNSSYLGLQDEYQALDDEHQQLTLIHQNLKAEHSRLEDEYSQLDTRHQDLNRQQGVLGEQYNNLEAQYAQLDKRYQVLDSDHQQLVAKHETLQGDNDAALARLDSLKQENLRLGGAISDARAQHQVLWDDLRVKNKLIEGLEDDNADLQSQVIRKNSRIAALLASVTATQAVDVASSGSTQATDIEDLGVVPGDETNANDESEQDSESTLVESDVNREAALMAKLARLQSEVDAQRSLLAEYQEQMVQMSVEHAEESGQSQHELIMVKKELALLAEVNRKLENQLGAAQAMLDEGKVEQARLNAMISESQAEKDRLAQEKAQLEQQLADLRQRLDQISAQMGDVLKEKAIAEQKIQEAVDETARLELQLNGLIPLEAASEMLKRHLDSGLSKVTWQVPDQVDLTSSFEVIVTANVDNPVTGQLFVAELLPDSAFDLISAAVAEAQPENGSLQWRWRLKGRSEQKEARLDLFVHQQIQFEDHRILKQVYRDQAVTGLSSNNLWEKYGYWGLAILGGLLGGFLVGRLNQNNRRDSV